MKKRFLPFRMLLVIIILAQTTIVANATGGIGKYTPRTSTKQTAQAYMQSIRANQETGLIDPAWLIKGKQQTFRSADPLNWKTLGPDNFGSLTRAILYDKNDASNLYIGTMGGSIFKSSYNGLTWQLVCSANAMISCMAQSSDGTIYVGTGDGRGAHNQNGLSHYNYETSFIGSGIYKLVNNNLEQIPSTVPAVDNGWGFVNEMAFAGNVLYAATDGGLRYSADDGSSWTFAKDTDNADLTGKSCSVKVGSDGTILATVNKDVYMSTGENFKLLSDGTIGLPADTVHKIIAIAPSDPNYMYASYLTTTFGTGNIYYTKDHGNTWQVALPATNIYNIYDTRGLLDNAISVYPNNPRKLLIGGIDLWTLEDATNSGVYTPRQISLSNSSYYTSLASNSSRFVYVHCGIQKIVFNPNNVGVFYVGTEGGIFKGEFYEGEYSFKNGNRYFVTANEHTSVARMFGVGVSGEDNQVLGGCLDHGAIFIYGDENVNNVTTGKGIFPNQDNATNAWETYGQIQFPGCGNVEISTVNPEAMFISDASHALLRTEHSGDDYDKSNFNSNGVLINENAFKTPFVLFENYNDNVKRVKAEFKDIYFYSTRVAGDEVYVNSNNANYPFKYTLTQEDVDSLNSPFNEKRSILVDDRVSAKILVAVEDTILMSYNALKFDTAAQWLIVSYNDNAIHSCIAIDATGNVAFAGTVDGKLCRMSNLNAHDTTTALLAESTTAVSTLFNIPEFSGRAITSIAFDPKNYNNVIVTLGNYGNDDYVYYSHNATDDSPTFTSIQNNLPKAPVYSSIIERKTGKVILGTENGIYTAESISNPTWVSDGNLANVPVMDLKQQILANHDIITTYLINQIMVVNNQDTTYKYDSTAVYFKGISNEGMVYAATYGRGLYKCDNFKEGLETGIIEPAAPNTNLSMTVYPNPVVSDATVCFNVEETSQVSYQIFDLSGRLVSSQVMGEYQNGTHKITLNLENLNAGAYIIRVQAGSLFNTSKILVY